MAETKRYLAVLGYHDSQSFEQVALVLQVCTQSVRDWITQYLVNGVDRLQGKKSPGRPSRLTKTQKKERSNMMAAGPAAHGFLGACWRTPMIQYVIKNKFGIFYSTIYLSE